MSLRPLLHSAWPGKANTPLTQLDLAFARTLNSLQASADERHLWLAALVSHQWGRGHACLDVHAWPDGAADVLGWPTAAVQALPSQLAEAVPTLPWAMGEHSPLVVQGQRLYLRRAWDAEQSIHHGLMALQHRVLPTPTDLSPQLDALFAPDPSDMQRAACAHAVQHAVTLITGGPGTGKTTTVVKLLLLLQATADAPLRILLTAPTGKAAARLAQAISQARGQLPALEHAHWPSAAHTLHKLLQTQRDATPRLDADVVVVDEASMIDLELMARLVKAVPSSARLVLLGDKDQLASVEAGAVMAQLCQAPWLAQHTMALVKSHRFDAEQGIGPWARAANAGDSPTLQTLWAQAPQACFREGAAVSRISRIHSHDSNTLQGLRQAWTPWLTLLEPHLHGQPCDDAQALALLASFSRVGVLCAMREGPWGVNAFNAQLQGALGFADAPWYVGRPVMARRNDYALGLMNGDTGLCLLRWVHGEARLRVAFADGQGGIRWQVPSRLAAVDTVFAMTVHQSQGSEFEQVLLVLPDQPAPLLTRELVYTGMTRARQQLCVWAPDPALLITACERTVQRSGGLAALGDPRSTVAK